MWLQAAFTHYRIYGCWFPGGNKENKALSLPKYSDAIFRCVSLLKVQMTYNKGVRVENLSEKVPSRSGTILVSRHPSFCPPHSSKKTSQEGIIPQKKLRVKNIVSGRARKPSCHQTLTDGLTRGYRTTPQLLKKKRSKPYFPLTPYVADRP